jgi:hypothetical protein
MARVDFSGLLATPPLAHWQKLTGGLPRASWQGSKGHGTTRSRAGRGLSLPHRPTNALAAARGAFLALAGVPTARRPLDSPAESAESWSEAWMK